VETVASIFMVESFSDVMVTICQVTRRHVPENFTLSDTLFVILHQPVTDVRLLQGKILLPSDLLTIGKSALRKLRFHCQ
jgi:hypothetical protein